jgi:hypothetical protein
MTRTSVQTLAGQGLIGVAKDEFPHQGTVWSFIAAFAEVEVDTETGEHRILEYLPVADVGTVRASAEPRRATSWRRDTRVSDTRGPRTSSTSRPTGKLISRRLYQNKASHDPRHPAGDAVGGREHSRSEQSRRSEGRRRSGRSGRQRRGAVRDSERHRAAAVCFARQSPPTASSKRSPQTVRVPCGCRHTPEENHGRHPRRHAGIPAVAARLAGRRPEASRTTGDRTPGSWPADSTASTGSKTG